jgi:D-arabinose 1-dehydrogenase-like Zn-dependent alcohol dehydrogenase
VARFVRQAFSDYGIPLTEIAGELSAPTGSEVLVRVGHCGVCHSDLHLHDGYFDLGGGRKAELAGGRDLPFTLGHEIEGTIEATGPDAGGGQIGRRVAIYPWIGCGECPTCKRGDEHLCAKPRQIGIQVDGGYASHVMVPHPRYLLDYDPIPAALAGTYMCSGVTAFSSVKKLGPAADEGPALLVGMGGVGMMGLAFVVARSRQAPIVAEIDPAKRALALERGAGAAVDPADPAARKAVIAASNGGVMGAIDFVGSDKSAAFAYGALAKGGRLVVSGLIGGEMKLSVPTLPLKGVSILGNYVGSLAEAKEMLALMRSGSVQPIPVLTRPLAEAQAGLDDLRAGRTVGRQVLVP